MSRQEGKTLRLKQCLVKKRRADMNEKVATFERAYKLWDWEPDQRREDDYKDD